MKRRDILLSVPLVSLAGTLPVLAEPVGVPSMFMTKAIQKTPVWCWAAVLEMLLKHHGVPWEQEDIVAAIKGQLVVETASSGEISAFLNGLKLNANGTIWRAKCLAGSGAPKVQYVNYELKNNRPFILQIQLSPQMRHVVLVTSVNMIDEGNGTTRLAHVSYVDPLDGQVHVFTGKQFYDRALSYWFVKINEA
ncbi:hypothetical protein ABIC63_000759 [Pseudacidovorax sp. 1753]|uniref:papain-like cysteine protease family protein n=1 Tax=Pseudacidovorax sp. 1753 TaxID=3156419 RepID=UPI003390B02E